MQQPQRSGMFVSGSLVLGFGLGGLADGIMLHEVLQWHNLVSRRVANDTLAGLQANVFWDGVFHLSTTVLLVTGIVILWRAAADPGRTIGGVRSLAGVALIGWGAFHAVDQLVFHELLHLHDIRDAAAKPGIYNWGFFVIGLVLAGAGAALARGTRGVTRRR